MKKSGVIFIFIIAIMLIGVLVVGYEISYYEGTPTAYTKAAEIIGDYDITQLAVNAYWNEREEYAIGVNCYDMPVFKNPDQAFEQFQIDCKNEIETLRKECGLPKLNKRNWNSYKIGGTSTGYNVACFLDIYDNSFE